MAALAKLVRTTAKQKVGGAEGMQGISGSLTPDSHVKLIRIMGKLFNMNKHHIIVDAGSAIGEMAACLWLLLPLPLPKIAGFELCEIKWQKSLDLMQELAMHGFFHSDDKIRQVVKDRHAALPDFQHAQVASLSSLSGATVVISFWEGWSDMDKQKLAGLSRTVQYAVIIQRKSRQQGFLQKLGWPEMQVVGEVPVKLAGSRQNFTAYMLAVP